MGGRKTAERGSLTEAEQRAAIARLRQRAADGALSEDRLAKLTTEVWRSNTPHEMHRRTGGVVGERRRRDRREWLRAAAVWTAIACALVVITWLTVMAAKDGLLGGS